LPFGLKGSNGIIAYNAGTPVDVRKSVALDGLSESVAFEVKVFTFDLLLSTQELTAKIRQINDITFFIL
jgi:hypothetical protein